MSYVLQIHGKITVAEKTEERVRDAIALLPTEDDYPWLTRAIFYIPPKTKFTTYEDFLVPFGMSMSETIEGLFWFNSWLEKFEALLNRISKCSAVLTVEFEMHDTRTYQWLFGLDGTLERWLSVGDDQAAKPVDSFLVARE